MTDHYDLSKDPENWTWTFNDDGKDPDVFADPNLTAAPIRF